MKQLFSLLIVSLLTLTAYSQTQGDLTVSVMTSKTSVPTYNNQHIVAIWIEDGSNKFVKTLLALAGVRKQYLLNWKAQTTAAGVAYNVTDAVTGATQTSHTVRTAKWNGKNRSSVLVADGTYKVKMELTDNDGNKQNLASFSFDKGTSVVSLTPATTSGFSNINIQWTPLGTPVEVVESNEEYKIFPNPSSHVLNVSGNDIEQIELCTLDGRVLYKTSVPTVNVSFLPEGVYFLNIKTNKETISRKFYKR